MTTVIFPCVWSVNGSRFRFNSKSTITKSLNDRTLISEARLINDAVKKVLENRNCISTVIHLP